MASETPSLQTRYAYIVHTPGVLNGEARIEGHRIRVRDIAIARDRDGLTPDEIVTRVYPTLALGQVYSALAYYEDHREEMHGAAEEESRNAEQFRREHPNLVRDLTGDKE